MPMLGVTSGQIDAGGGFDATRHVPAEQRASWLPHAPKSHVVPSGNRHTLPWSGRALGQSAGAAASASTPLSVGAGVAAASSPHAPVMAAAADTITSAIATGARARRRSHTAGDYREVR